METPTMSLGGGELFATLKCGNFGSAKPLLAHCDW